MYKLKILIGLETDSAPSVFDPSMTSLAWYESVSLDNVVDVYEVALALDDFVLRNCLWSSEENRKRFGRDFFENIFSRELSQKFPKD